MKSKLITCATIFISAVLLIMVYIRCTKTEDDVLVFMTKDVNGITQISAVSGGMLDDREIAGTWEISEKGVCWGKINPPVINDNRTIDGSGMGNYSSYIFPLTPNTKYYMQAYAIYKGATVYSGVIKTFTTLSYDSIRFRANLIYASISDIEGNLYKTILIGSQVWMAENLRVKKFSDGADIPNVPDNFAWNKLTSAAYCDFRNASPYSDVYGRIYNWEAVATNNICPDGWHVPSDTEWKTLEISLGMSVNDVETDGWRGNQEGLALKEEGENHWSENTGVSFNNTNTSGFTALPDGFRNIDGSFGYSGHYSGFWTATASNAANSWYRALDYNKKNIKRSDADKKTGYWVRCVQN